MEVGQEIVSFEAGKLEHEFKRIVMIEQLEQLMVTYNLSKLSKGFTYIVNGTLVNNESKLRDEKVD